MTAPSKISNVYRRLLAATLLLLAVVLFAASCPIRKSIESFTAQTAQAAKNPSVSSRSIAAIRSQASVCVFLSKVENAVQQGQRPSIPKTLQGDASPHFSYTVREPDVLVVSSVLADASDAPSRQSTPLYLRNRRLLI